jgi:hypothetical protein
MVVVFFLSFSWLEDLPLRIDVSFVIQNGIFWKGSGFNGPKKKKTPPPCTGNGEEG